MSKMHDFLHEWCGKRQIKPQYEIQSSGPQNNPHYTCKLRLNGYEYVGIGSSPKKDDAMEVAARDYVYFLRKKNILAKKELPPEERFGGPVPNLTSHRIWSRGILVLGALVVVYFTTSRDGVTREKTFALVTERIHHRSQEVTCSEDYKEELKSFVQGCIPKRCGRIVTDSLLSKVESDALLAAAIKGFLLNPKISKSGSLGAASILDLYSGALTSGRGNSGEFIDARRLPHAKNLFTAHGIRVFSDLKNRMREAIRIHYSLGHDAGASPYLTHPLFFSRLTSEEPNTVHDHYWVPHVDKETYESFHYTGLVYLNDYNKHFTGGRFIYRDTYKSPLNRTVEPKTGRVSIFTSGSENLHQVERVKSGVRYALTLSFTCNPDAAIEDISPAFLRDS
ncbi:2-oxoglutarate and iron-dependent oxygenase domain-containing protein 3-like [Ischnura elegans]|uniref:2-oxoglutarate and iron-dependent oxygenase domain-containing protein 3-like n=1 Tax=Ischnura elegans TaxID=197161 RepID=UPI001ED8867B|nr:2-oxoglutarate and iron-dependent oxygenase domain-containing protein 3-like [Ischnura elegans]